MHAVTQVEIEQIIWQAKNAQRKRAMFNLHQPQDYVQRMINALIPGTYIRPHKHENPDKVELFSILKGKVAVLKFSEIGEVEAVLEMDEHGPIKIVDIPPRTYHAIVALQPSALLEIIEGPYDEDTHKQLAPWAPLEGSPKASDYLIYMTSIVDNWKVQLRN